MKLHQAYKLYLYFILFPPASLNSTIDLSCEGVCVPQQIHLIFFESVVTDE